MFSTSIYFFREIPLNNSRAIFTRACYFVQTCLHQILLYLDKPILQYNCQTCLLKNKHLTRTCTQKFTTSKGEGGDFVSRAILRCGYIHIWYLYIYICRYTFQEVQLVPGIINFICAVSSQLQIAAVLLGGEVVSQIHFCKQLIFVKTQQLSCYPSTSWWAYRSLFAKSFESYSTWHFKTQMTKKKSATCTYVDVMSWWCLKILNSKKLAVRTFLHFTWVLKFLRWHNEWMAPNQGCLSDPLLTISASTVSSTVTGTGKVGGSPTPSHWKHPDIWFINSMLLRFSSLIIRWSSVWIMKMVWRWYDFCFSHGPMLQISVPCNGPNGPIFQGLRSWKLASWRIRCWTVPPVCRKSPSSSSGGSRGGSRWGNSNSIPQIVVGLSQVGWNLDWFQWSTQVLCSCFFAN